MIRKPHGTEEISKGVSGLCWGSSAVLSDVVCAGAIIQVDAFMMLDGTAHDVGWATMPFVDVLQSILIVRPKFIKDFGST